MESAARPAPNSSKPARPSGPARRRIMRKDRRQTLELLTSDDEVNELVETRPSAYIEPSTRRLLHQDRPDLRSSFETLYYPQFDLPDGRREAAARQNGERSDEDAGSSSGSSTLASDASPSGRFNGGSGIEDRVRPAVVGSVAAASPPSAGLSSEKQHQQFQKQLHPASLTDDAAASVDASSQSWAIKNSANRQTDRQQQAQRSAIEEMDRLADEILRTREHRQPSKLSTFDSTDGGDLRAGEQRLQVDAAATTPAPESVSKSKIASPKKTVAFRLPEEAALSELRARISGGSGGGSAASHRQPHSKFAVGQPVRADFRLAAAASIEATPNASDEASHSFGLLERVALSQHRPNGGGGDSRARGQPVRADIRLAGAESAAVNQTASQNEPPPPDEAPVFQLRTRVVEVGARGPIRGAPDRSAAAGGAADEPARPSVAQQLRAILPESSQPVPVQTPALNEPMARQNQQLRASPMSAQPAPADKHVPKRTGSLTRTGSYECGVRRGQFRWPGGNNGSLNPPTAGEQPIRRTWSVMQQQRMQFQRQQQHQSGSLSASNPNNHQYQRQQQQQQQQYLDEPPPLPPRRVQKASLVRAPSNELMARQKQGVGSFHMIGRGDLNSPSVDHVYKRTRVPAVKHRITVAPRQRFEQLRVPAAAVWDSQNGSRPQQSHLQRHDVSPVSGWRAQYSG